MCKKRLVLLRRAPRSKRARFARRLLTEWVDWQHSSVHPLSLPPGSEAGGGNSSPGGKADARSTLDTAAGPSFQSESRSTHQV
jgi:hypothetical protein